MIVEICSRTFTRVVIKNNYELNKYIEKTCAGLMDKIGDNNARLREKTEEAALKMASHPSIGP